MIRLGITLLVLLMVAGCYHPKSIPEPTKSWIYIETNESDAELSLLLKLESARYGDVGQKTFYYKRKNLPPNVIYRQAAMPHMYFGSGDNWHVSGSTSVRLKGSSPKVSVSRSHLSDTLEYKIEEELYITYMKTGQVSTNGLTCSWIWTEINSPNQKLEPTVKTPVE